MNFMGFNSHCSEKMAKLGVFMGHIWDLPSGYVKIAIENGPVEIVNFAIQNGGSFHSYVSRG